MHIGIILDGNGRWASDKGLPRSIGHKRGAENVWGSNPNIFEPMLQKNNLKITHDFASKQYPLDMWYLGIMRESAER